MSQPFVAAIFAQLVSQQCQEVFQPRRFKIEAQWTALMRESHRHGEARTTENDGALGLVPRPREDCTDESWGSDCETTAVAVLDLASSFGSNTADANDCTTAAP